ncbi:MAG TPA: hypothetical protein DEB40_04800 [Elusimicrobia bacterium]|nr:hypothetical protein [Elusimicrobiota bacterium]HBT61042.1 hypothetical protein [Elusimicrobiota bacterium]
MAECPQKTQNLRGCNCTYSCSTKGKCCECLAYHREAGEFPACFFGSRAERAYDRSFAALVRDRQG